MVPMVTTLQRFNCIANHWYIFLFHSIFYKDYNAKTIKNWHWFTYTSSLFLFRISIRGGLKHGLIFDGYLSKDYISKLGPYLGGKLIRGGNLISALRHLKEKVYLSISNDFVYQKLTFARTSHFSFDARPIKRSIRFLLQGASPVSSLPTLGCSSLHQYTL